MTPNPGYWTRKHWARSNMEVIRTLTGVLAAIFQSVALGHFFGWW